MAIYAPTDSHLFVDIGTISATEKKNIIYLMLIEKKRTYQSIAIK